MASKKASRKIAPPVLAKQPLADEITRIIDDRGLTQTEAGYIIRDSPSQVSLIVNGNLKGFSSERLLRTLVRLGRDVEIRISKSTGKAGKVRVSVS